jgi:hypothetical protein
MHMENTVTVDVADQGARWTSVCGHRKAGTDFASERQMVCCDEALRPFRLENGLLGGVCQRCGQQFINGAQVSYGGSPWIGVDLDGTLARDLGNKRREEREEIGSPIEPMLARVRKWIAEGRTVKIFTARASSPRQVAAVREWLTGCGLPDLEVTNVKDHRMTELWDDRCVQVTTNLGEPVAKKAGSSHSRQVKPVKMVARDQQGMPFGFVNRLRILLAL